MNSTHADSTGSPGAASRPRRISFMSAAASLVEATNAFRNVRAIVLLGLTFVGAALVAAVFGWLASSTGSTFVAGIGGLLSFAVVFYGANAVGILLMREVQGQPVLNIVDAVIASLQRSHRLVVVMLLQLLILLAAVIAVAVLLFICKLPFIGPLLLAVVFPLSALLLGVLVFSLFYVMLPLAGPAVWSGSTAFQTIAQLNAIARRRLVPLILLQVALLVITLFTAMLIFTVVFIGISMAGGLSAGIIGMGASGLDGMMNGMSFGGTGHMVAVSVGGGLLLAIAAVVPGLIFAKGMCIIYLDVTRDIDFSQSEAGLQEGLSAMRKKASEAAEHAKALAEQARPAAAAPVSSNPARGSDMPHAPQSVQPTMPATPASEPAQRPVLRSMCPNCQSPIAPEDAFCGNCGFKLR